MCEPAHKQPPRSQPTTNNSKNQLHTHTHTQNANTHTSIHHTNTIIAQALALNPPPEQQPERFLRGLDGGVGAVLLGHDALGPWPRTGWGESTTRAPMLRARHMHGPIVRVHMDL